MHTHDIKITVLVPAYNAAKYIGEAIRSVLGQTYGRFELLIVNDGSTDNLEEVVNSFKDPRIRLLSQENKGVSAALNKGLAAAHGQYIARFDADDICYPERLAVQLAFLEANPDHVLVGSDVDYITEEGAFIYRHHCFAYKDHEIQDKLYFYCPFIHSSVMYRKAAVLEAGGYDPLAHSFEDYLLWVHLLKKGKAANFPQSLVRVRLNPGSVTIDEKWRGEDFLQLKRTIVLRGSVSIAEAGQLSNIIAKQDTRRIKTGAYYALCAKKFLADNFQPDQARRYALRAIRANPLRWDNYALWVACNFPERWIQWIHKQRPNRL
jgi:hypothetical protein